MRIVELNRISRAVVIQQVPLDIKRPIRLHHFRHRVLCKLTQSCFRSFVEVAAVTNSANFVEIVTRRSKSALREDADVEAVRFEDLNCLSGDLVLGFTLLIRIGSEAKQYRRADLALQFDGIGFQFLQHILTRRRTESVELLALGTQRARRVTILTLMIASLVQVHSPLGEFASRTTGFLNDPFSFIAFSLCQRLLRRGGLRARHIICFSLTNFDGWSQLNDICVFHISTAI